MAIYVNGKLVAGAGGHSSGTLEGDMQTSTYDPTGKRQDIFAYVDKKIGEIGNDGIVGVTSFNGRTGIIVPQIGDYTPEMISALPKDGTAVAATKLATARTVRTNLASTSAANFDGSANISPGVTGILPITNGGTGVSSLSALQDLLGSSSNSNPGNISVLRGNFTLDSSNNRQMYLEVNGGAGHTFAPFLIIRINLTSDISTSNTLLINLFGQTTEELTVTNRDSGISVNTIAYDYNTNTYAIPNTTINRAGPNTIYMKSTGNAYGNYIITRIGAQI